MAYLLSDDELRQKLEFYGEKVGPVTSTTRRPMEKKLDALLGKHNRTLNALSSDDSDLEPRGTPDRVPNRKKRHNHRTSHLPPIAQQFGSLNLSQREEVFKKPLSSAPRHFPRSSPVVSPKSGPESKANALSNRRSLGSPKRTAFDLELSDSDVDTESLVNPMRTLKLRNRNSNHVLRKSGEGYLKRSQRPASPGSQSGEDFLQPLKNADQPDRDLQMHVPQDGYRSTPLKHNRDCNANGFLLGESLNGMFASSSKTSKTTNYSYCVSWMLVLVVAAFFIFLGVFYMSAVQKTHFSASKTNLESLICKKEGMMDCIPHEYFKYVLLTSHDLHDLLSTVAGEYECHYGRESRNLSLSATKLSLQDKFASYNVGPEISFEKVLKYAILLFLENPDWGISIFTVNGEQYTAEMKASGGVHYVSALESKHASKSFWCRVKHSIRWTMSKLLLVASAIAVICLGFVLVRYWKRMKDQEEREFYELVEKILDVLQSCDEGSTSYANATLRSKAVAHLRDSIIPLKERRAKQHLWDKAVAFIEENESRVQVDYERIGGEDFKVWRWLPSPMSEIEEGKKGKVWQGQAFGSLSKGKNHVPYSPTPCLKIRNMFDSEVEYGDDWQISIKDAILEKCEGNNGIVHIAVDVTSKEGCVYMLCDCPESAGKAYSALHGWWFDGKLVTVKYLRLERYLQRFPEAEDCDEPLKPSNNKRLSLSTPFFSSALERS